LPTDAPPPILPAEPPTVNFILLSVNGIGKIVDASPSARAAFAVKPTEPLSKPAYASAVPIFALPSSPALPTYGRALSN